MKKKTKLKYKQKQKQNQKQQKQKQSIVVNIDNSRKSISKPREKRQQQQPTYIPQISYERPVFREEPVRPPVFNINPPAYNPPQLLPQQVSPQAEPSQLTIEQIRNARLKAIINQTIQKPPSKSVGFQTDTPSFASQGFQTDTPSNTQRNFIPEPATPPPSSLVTAKKELEKINNTPHSTFGRDAFDNQADTMDFRLPFLLPPANEDSTRDIYNTSQTNITADDISTTEIPDTPPPRRETFCAEIIKTGAKKGQPCGRKCLPNSNFCGLHKNSDLQFNKPMEKYIVRK